MFGNYFCVISTFFHWINQYLNIQSREKERARTKSDMSSFSPNKQIINLIKK